MLIVDLRSAYFHYATARRKGSGEHRKRFADDAALQFRIAGCAQGKAERPIDYQCARRRDFLRGFRQQTD